MKKYILLTLALIMAAVTLFISCDVDGGGGGGGGEEALLRIRCGYENHYEQYDMTFSYNVGDDVILTSKHTSIPAHGDPTGYELASNRGIKAYSFGESIKMPKGGLDLFTVFY